MEFKKFRDTLETEFHKMTKDISHLFQVEVDKDEMWNLYLDSYPEGTNEVFRVNREYDCSCCRHFVKSIGNVVVIKDNKIHTIWDLKLNDDKYQVVCDAMAVYIRSKTVTDVWLSPFEMVGCYASREQMENGSIHTWDHFGIKLPKKFVNCTNKSLGDIYGTYRDTRKVFMRSLKEISMDAIDTVLELIVSNTLYKGEEWKGAIQAFKQYKKDFDKLNDAEKELYVWEKSLTAGIAIGRIRNHSIGTLLINISEDMELDLAVRKYEQITAPSNYKRPKAIFTKKMLEDAKKTIAELGYMDSLNRRHATLDDITVNNILFSNKDAAKRITGGISLFDEMEKDVTVNPKQFSKVEEISVSDFVEKVLPTARDLEVFLENRHMSNMVSLIAPLNPDSKSMFKWDNGFSWAYSGNITDSMKENVKAAGGKVDGVLRFSIQWNELGDFNSCDYDAHCKEPSGEEIYFGHDFSRTNGNLDVDIRIPIKGKPAVENITWPSLSKMTDGTYTFFVHVFSQRRGKDGFRAEIEFDGQIYSFDYTQLTRDHEIIKIAEVTLRDGHFTIKELLNANSKAVSKDVWGIKTNTFVPVSVMCYSPNYWDDQNGIGHRHYFFMLKDCVNPEEPNGMFNEFLKPELEQHKRVFEALGAKAHVESVKDQLSGIGFSATKRNDVLVKVKGQTERVLRVKF